MLTPTAPLRGILRSTPCRSARRRKPSMEQSSLRRGFTSRPATHCDSRQPSALGLSPDPPKDQRARWNLRRSAGHRRRDGASPNECGAQGAKRASDQLKRVMSCVRFGGSRLRLAFLTAGNLTHREPGSGTFTTLTFSSESSNQELFGCANHIHSPPQHEHPIPSAGCGRYTRDPINGLADVGSR
jgi:hypothetical protein